MYHTNSLWGLENKGENIRSLQTLGQCGYILQRYNNGVCVLENELCSILYNQSPWSSRTLNQIFICPFHPTHPKYCVSSWLKQDPSTCIFHSRPLFSCAAALLSLLASSHLRSALNFAMCLNRFRLTRLRPTSKRIAMKAAISSRLITNIWDRMFIQSSRRKQQTWGLQTWVIHTLIWSTVWLNWPVRNVEWTSSQKLASVAICHKPRLLQNACNPTRGIWLWATLEILLLCFSQAIARSKLLTSRTPNFWMRLPQSKSNSLWKIFTDRTHQVSAILISIFRFGNSSLANEWTDRASNFSSLVRKLESHQQIFDQTKEVCGRLFLIFLFHQCTQGLVLDILSLPPTLVLAHIYMSLVPYSN